ncbi:MAG: 4-alpha-glucanotransferase [Pseudomonadota bacterium]
MTTEPANAVAKKREAGIILHPTSLPGNGQFGELGNEALQFLDFLADAGQRLWQVLPLGPVHEDLSPYQALSAFAGNPELIGCKWLLDALPTDAVTKAALSRHELIALHYREYRRSGLNREQFEDFCRQQSHWLDDYAMFRVLKDRFEQRGWNEWPVEFRDRHPDALSRLEIDASEPLAFYRYQQYLFYQQWHRVRRYANNKGIRILGDMPIFVAYDSTDVWAHRQAFLLDEAGLPTVVAGVPPDYFSDTGQRWGNPHYDWEWMKANGFQWWRQRVAQHMELFDLFRVDHFRGFEACWEIPAQEETAVNGRWVNVPGDALFASLQRTFGELPIVAEDLGVITPEVTALRRKYHLPGMLILQFAFDSGPDNPYLPHNHTEDSVVYTGTHDNDTTLGWYRSLSHEQKHRVQEYLGFPDTPMPWALIECAYASVAKQAVVPMQDVLGLGTEHRMNVPGTQQGNWRWRFQWHELSPEMVGRLRTLAERYQRESP